MHSTLVKRLFLTLSLLVVLLASCAPATATSESPSQPEAPVVVAPSATAIPDSPTESVAPSTDVVAAPTEAAEPTPFPVATSRGPELHATDPRTVNLASGGLQFVEFFRFT